MDSTRCHAGTIGVQKRPRSIHEFSYYHLTNPPLSPPVLSIWIYVPHARSIVIHTNRPWRDKMFGFPVSCNKRQHEHVAQWLVHLVWWVFPAFIQRKHNRASMGGIFCTSHRTVIRYVHTFLVVVGFLFFFHDNANEMSKSDTLSPSNLFVGFCNPGFTLLALYTFFNFSFFGSIN